jgi:hypothetical protein
MNTASLILAIDRLALSLLSALTLIGLPIVAAGLVVGVL